MRSSFILLFLTLVINSLIYGQNSSIDLTFSAVSDTSWIQLDSIKVLNQSQGCDTVLYWNDTVLVMALPVGMNEPKKGKSVCLRSYPNPVSDQAIIEFCQRETGRSVIRVNDISGRIVFSLDKQLQEGIHKFRFVPGNSRLYFITVSCNGNSETIKIINLNAINHQCTISYLGSETRDLPYKNFSASLEFEFLPGDELLLIGYTDTLESGLVDSPEEDTVYIFQFAFNISCPGVPALIHEGRVYHTVQVFSQCWLKENLNVGTMINGNIEMTDNEIIEKYCYSNDTNRCNQYGGLYQWNEMMNYSIQQGTQGICPPGWHIPTDEEWKILEGAADSQYGIGDPIWNLYGLRGYDAGTHLKSTNGWYGGGNGTDSFGFSGLSGGYRFSDGNFYFKGMHALWWSSTDGNATSAWNRYLSYNNPIVDRDYGNNKGFGFSVRCVKD